MSLESQLSIFRRNYSPGSFSVGSCMYFGTFCEEYDLKLNNIELRELGYIIGAKIEKDFLSTTDFILDSLRSVYGENLILPKKLGDLNSYSNFDDYYKKISNFYNDNPKFGIKTCSLESQRKIKTVSKNGTNLSNLKPIETYILTNEDLINLNPEMNPNIFKNFSNARWGKKSVESAILKYLIRVGRIFHPNEKDLLGIDYRKTNLISEKDVQESLIYFMGYMLQSGKSFHETMNDQDYLILAEQYNVLKSHFGPHFMTLASDIILRDVGRGTIVVQGEDYDKFKCLFKKGVSSYTNIEFEDNLSTNIKDRSVSSAFLGFDEGSYFEMRLKYPYIDIEAEFGKYEHLKYKKSELEDYLKKHKNSEFLQKCLDKLCVIFNTNSKDVLTL